MADLPGGPFFGACSVAETTLDFRTLSGPDNHVKNSLRRPFSHARVKRYPFTVAAVYAPRRSRNETPPAVIGAVNKLESSVIPLLARPQGGVAASSRKFRAATEADAAGVVFHLFICFIGKPPRPRAQRRLRNNFL